MLEDESQECLLQNESDEARVPPTTMSPQAHVALGPSDSSPIAPDLFLRPRDLFIYCYMAPTQLNLCQAFHYITIPWTSFRD